MTEDTHSVLVVAKDSKLSQSISAMLLAPLFETDVLSDFNEARRRVAERSYNIILVDYAEGEGDQDDEDIFDDEEERDGIFSKFAKKIKAAANAFKKMS